MMKRSKTIHNYRKQFSEKGYILATILVLLAISSIVVIALLSETATTLKTQHSVKEHSEEYYRAEGGVGHGISWLRQYSQQMVKVYRRDQFYTHFERVSPAIRSNDLSDFAIQTLIDLAGTNNSAIITNDSGLATSAFPTTEDITTNTVFPAISNFQSADMGNTSARITLINAIPDIPSEDYGGPPNPTPETDFYPVYRVDAMSAENEGAHVYATVIGDLAHVFDMGIYGQDFLQINQPCDSYDSATTTYSILTRNANCPAGSNSTAAVHQNEEVYGSLQTNGTIVSDPPFGGDTCSDFIPGCPNKGETCAGEDCGVPLLEIYNSFTTYCPLVDQQPTLVVTTNKASPMEITVVSAAPSDSCWAGITAGSNRGFKITTTAYPYYIGELNLANNATFFVEPDVAGGYIELYVNKITGDKLNGNQMVNVNGRPFEFRMIYLGGDSFMFNGTAAINVAFVAPNAEVEVSGNFEYQGALLAKELTLQGSGGIHYDESLGGSGPVSDIQLRVVEMLQYYR